jgi:hypothetical protein
MQIRWRDTSGKLITGNIEAEVQPFVKALGMEVTAKLLLRLGGAAIQVGLKPRKDSRIVKAIGMDSAIALGALFAEASIKRLPLANRFLARFLRSRGRSVGAIAAALRVADVTVRSYLLPDKAVRERRLAAKDFFDRAKCST